MNKDLGHYIEHDREKITAIKKNTRTIKRFKL